MKSLTFNKKGIKHEPIKFWNLSNGEIISIYQGNRGGCPEIDFVVKYLEPGKRLRAPSHTHWIVDLLMKAEVNKEGVKNFIEEWIKIYDETVPFSSVKERNDFNPKYKGYFEGKYFYLNPIGKYSIEFLSYLIELFIKCEKKTNDAFMFRSLLNLVKEYCEGKKDFYQVISLSKRV